MEYIKIKPQPILNATANYVQIIAKEFITKTDCVDFKIKFFENVVFKPMPMEGPLLFTRQLSMTGKDLKGWGNDDTYAEDWCLNKLGLSRDTKINK